MPRLQQSELEFTITESVDHEANYFLHRAVFLPWLVQSGHISLFHDTERKIFREIKVHMPQIGSQSPHRQGLDLLKDLLFCCWHSRREILSQT